MTIWGSKKTVINSGKGGSTVLRFAQNSPGTLMNQCFLKEFLYQAIFIPEGVTSPERSIVDQPELQVYIENFGKNPDDHCIAAEVDGRIVGAVWVRIMNDYGHIDDQTPSLAISLLPEYRGQGIGTELMKRMLSLLRESGYPGVSLSVQKANYAVKLYRSLGFEVVRENEEEYIMLRRL